MVHGTSKPEISGGGEAEIRRRASEDESLGPSVEGVVGPVDADKAYALYSKSLLDAAISKIMPLRQSMVKRVRLSKKVRLGVTLLTAALVSALRHFLDSHPEAYRVVK